MSIKTQIEVLKKKRKKQNKEIDAELAKLRVLCGHERKKNYPSRLEDTLTECLDCGKWW